MQIAIPIVRDIALEYAVASSTKVVGLQGSRTIALVGRNIVGNCQSVWVKPKSETAAMTFGTLSRKRGIAQSSVNIASIECDISAHYVLIQGLKSAPADVSVDRIPYKEIVFHRAPRALLKAM